MRRVSITYNVEDSFFERWAKAHATGPHDTNGTVIVGFELHDEDANEQEDMDLTPSHATWCDRKTCDGECWEKDE